MVARVFIRRSALAGTAALVAAGLASTAAAGSATATQPAPSHPSSTEPGSVFTPIAPARAVNPRTTGGPVSAGAPRQV